MYHYVIFQIDEDLNCSNGAKIEIPWIKNIQEGRLLDAFPSVLSEIHVVVRFREMEKIRRNTWW